MSIIFRYRPLNEISAQSRPQLNSGVMNRMTGLLSRMLNDPRHRRNNNHQNESNVEDGIALLFGNEEISNSSASPAEASTSSGSGNQNHQQEPSSSSSSSPSSSPSSSSEDDSSSLSTPKYDYVRQKFVGHRNARTMIKEANFWGDDYVSEMTFAH